MRDWPHFSHEELRCKHCGECHMDEGFMESLERLRVDFGHPIPISSAYRCPTHNASVSSTGLAGPHTTGKAIDARVHGGRALKLLGMAPSYGFTGIGVAQKGVHSSRFIHLDTLTSDEMPPRPWVWSY